MKLSDLNETDIKPVETSSSKPSEGPLKLSGLSGDDIAKVGKSQTESALRGAAQGASFGFADELTGGLEAFKDALTSDVYGVQDIPDLYKKHRDESREEYKKAQEDNPYTYLAGEFGGSLAVPAGAIGAAKNAGLLTRLIAGAGAGAVAGGATSLGNAEQINAQALKDAAGDAAIGAGLGGALTGGAAAVGKVGSKFINKFEGTRDLAKVFNAAREGESLIGEKAAAKASKEVADTAEDYIKTLTNRKKSASNLYEEAKALQSSQDNIPALDQVQRIQDEVAQLSKNAPLSSEAKNISQVEDLLNRLVGKEEITTSRYVPQPVVAKPIKPTSEQKALQSTTNKMTKAQIEQDLMLSKRADEMAERLGVDRDVLYETLKKNYARSPQELVTDVPTASLTGQKASVAQAEGLPNVVTPIRPEVPEEALFTPIKEVTETTARFNKPAVNVNEINTRIQTLKDLAANSTSQYERDAYNKVISNLENIIPDNGSAVAYDTARKAYKEASDLLAKAGLDFGYDASHSGKLGLQQAQKNVGNEIRNYKPGKSQKTRIDDVLNDLEKTDPENAQRLRTQIQKAQDDARISGSSVERSGLSGGGLRELTGETTRAATLGTADILGKIAGTPKTVGSYIAKQSRAIYNASPIELQQVADNLIASGSPYAAKVQHAMSQPDRSRKALLFTLMQDPGFRSAIGGEDGK